MRASRIRDFNPEAAQLENILLVSEDLTFCKSEASFIVGGPGRLEKLVSEGKIRAEKRTNAQNGKWWCNAADVFRYCKNRRR